MVAGDFYLDKNIQWTIPLEVELKQIKSKFKKHTEKKQNSIYLHVFPELLPCCLQVLTCQGNLFKIVPDDQEYGV